MKASVFRTRALIFGLVAAAGGLAYAITAYFVEQNYGPNYEALHIVIAPIIAGAAAYIIGHELDRIRQQSKMLADAKEQFSTLTHTAITQRNWNVSFEDPSIPTCWEEKNCKSVDCPSYGRHHVRCWLIAGTYCRGEVQGHFAQKLGDCSKCEIYKTAIDRDPIDEIGENFNSIMWVLREKEDVLTKTNGQLQDKFEELEIMHRKAREMAETDMLTGLKNHAHFQEYLINEVEKANKFNGPLSLIMMDLDHFKTVNDEFGHQKGDEVLSRVGRLIRDEVGETGYSARYGGEEFVIVQPVMVASQAMELADRLRRRMKLVEDDSELPDGFVGASFGVADMPSCASDASSLISAADSALLFSKRKGRNRVAYFRDLSNTELREDDLDKLHSRLEGASLQTIWALAEAVDENDQYSSVNATRMTEVATAMAERLDLNEEKASALALATRLHDIGKVGVPSSVLQKKDKLSPDEVSMIQRHPEIGQRLLKEAQQIQDMISAILYHHERWDGKGYPEKLKGEEIPLMARIVGIIDAYRAMRSDRPYRKALSVEQSLGELNKGAGTQFDPMLVEMFIELIGDVEDIQWRQIA